MTALHAFNRLITPIFNALVPKMRANCKHALSVAVRPFRKSTDKTIFIATVTLGDVCLLT